MADPQLRLWPAARPLVERLGAAWFRGVPAVPGVYRMHDAAGNVIYVGKARDLRRRLASYRRTHGQPCRTVRLIHAAERIEWEACATEAEALRREAELILRLQPRYNRAGRWAPPGVRVRVELDPAAATARLGCVAEDEGDGDGAGPFREGARRAMRSLARLLWLAANPGAPASALPHALSSDAGAWSEAPLPRGDGWAGWVRDLVERGDPAVAWELAERVGGRAGAFEARYVALQWDALAGFARRHPARRAWAG